MAELPPAGVPSGSAGSLDAVGAAPGAGGSRTDTQHSTTSDARVGTKGEGEEGRRDGGMRWLFSWQGCPDPQLFQCPMVHWERGCGGFGKVTVT